MIDPTTHRTMSERSYHRATSRSPLFEPEQHVACDIASPQGAMCPRIDPSWWTHSAISRSSQCSTIGVTKPVVCVPLCSDSAYKRTLAANRKAAAAGFLSRSLSCPLLNVRRHITSFFQLFF